MVRSAWLSNASFWLPFSSHDIRRGLGRYCRIKPSSGFGYIHRNLSFLHPTVVTLFSHRCSILCLLPLISRTPGEIQMDPLFSSLCLFCRLIAPLPDGWRGETSDCRYSLRFWGLYLVETLEIRLENYGISRIRDLIEFRVK